MFLWAWNITYSSRSQSLEISQGSKYQHKLFPVRYVNLFVIHFAIQFFSKYVFYLKRLRLGKTTGWQHRFFDLIILSPIWLGTYEYMKSSLENFFFRFETGLPEWIFQIWSKIFKSDQVFVYTKKSLFWAFWGPAKVSRPLDITKVGAESEKTPKNWNGRSSRPNLPRMNFRL